MAVFARVVECGSFSTAAKQLGMTPAAVSRQVARLEKSLGVRLLERTTRSLRLSEAGAEIFPRCQDIITAARRTWEISNGFMDAPHGLVRVSVPKAFARIVLHPHLLTFLARYPEVDVQIKITDNDVDPIIETVDLVIRITDRPPPGLAARPLMAVRHVLCATPAYLAQHGVPEHPRQLGDHSCLYLGERPGDERWRLRRDGEIVDVTVHGRYVANHSEMRLGGVMAHLGIGCVPHFTAQQALKAGSVVPVLRDWELLGPYQGVAYVLYPPSIKLAPKLRVFIDHMVEALRDERPPGRVDNAPRAARKSA